MQSDRLIFMKVGNHANEPWDRILERKRIEFETAGQIFWGYGGSACHPINQVQPFARLSIAQQGSIALVMEPVDSRADPLLVPATEFSRDGVFWERLPKGINVTGSRFAFILGEIMPGDLDLQLADYDVGIGPNRGRPAELYLKGRTDKACLVKTSSARTRGDSSIRKVGYSASLEEPFAVLLR